MSRNELARPVMGTIFVIYSVKGVFSVWLCCKHRIGRADFMFVIRTGLIRLLIC